LPETRSKKKKNTFFQVRKEKVRVLPGKPGMGHSVLGERKTFWNQGKIKRKIPRKKGSKKNKAEMWQAGTRKMGLHEKNYKGGLKRGLVPPP